jgi:hypothetical protein
MHRLPLLSAALLVPALAQAQRVASSDTRAAPPMATAATAGAVRASQAPELDGKTTDPAWLEAQRIDQFLEYEPNEGAETRFKTEARVVYDDRYLYVLVRMFDPAPDSIVSLLGRRDVRVASEQLKIVIDSYHDRRTAYQFAVNPAGVKRDFYVYNDTEEDPSWDAVWDVATAVDSAGWVAEFRIPFSQLRFANRPEHTFGLMIVRDVQRTGARISWPLYHRNRQGYVSQSGELSGIRGIPSPRRLEVLPYAVTKNVTEPSGDGYSHPQEFTAGADVKYGISSNLTVDATVNPDFGQVEADPAVLNLSAFEQFFGERRPFFLEGTGIFSFNTQCDDIDSGCTGLFYSRRIGRSPQLLDDYGDATSPTATTIAGAAKVTGRLGSGLSVGLLDAYTLRERGVEDRTIEPPTNYAVGRLQQDFNGGSSGVGVMLTAVNRSLDAGTTDVLRREAYTGGVDLRHRFLKNNYELRGYLAASNVRGSADAIAATQTSGVHQFDRPDDDVEYDPTRTALTGAAQRVSVSKFGGDLTRFQTVYQRFSPGFETNDVGFQARADEQMFRNWFALQFNRPNLFYRMAFFNFNTWNFWTTEGLPLNTQVNTNWHVQLKNMWWVHSGVTASRITESYDDRSARGGPAERLSPSSNAFFGLEGDNRRRLTPFVFGGFHGGDAGHSHGWWVEPSMNFRASSRFSGSLGIYYEDLVNDNQWLDNPVDDAGTTHYTFARLSQTTTSLTTRLNFTATPNLSLQVYAQPFVSTGDYDDWREFDQPRASQYEARYRPYTAGGDPGGFNFKQFRSNTVVRWEYRPGSTIFFVWSQGRDESLDGASSFELGRDSRDLIELHPNNVFLIKASYWFNP